MVNACGRWEIGGKTWTPTRSIADKMIVIGVVFAVEVYSGKFVFLTIQSKGMVFGGDIAQS